jgi:hypothetical protein
VRIQESFDLDIFVRMNGHNLAELANGIEYHVLKSGVSIPYLNAEAILKTKQGSSRAKDRADIAALIDLRRARLPHDFSLDSVRDETAPRPDDPAPGR